MKHRLSLGLFWLLLLVFAFGCREDFLKEEQNNQSMSQTNSQLKIINLSDIPHVQKYIKMKTGRKDLKIPLNHSGIMAKGEIDFADLQSSLVLQKTEEDCVFYIFNIINAGDDRTVYTFEAKEVDGEIVRAEVIEYASDVPYIEDTISTFLNFHGRVSAYSLNGMQGSSIDFTDGISNCPEPPGGNYPPNNPPGGGIYIPPSGSYPSNPGYPSWPTYPSYPFNPPNGGENPPGGDPGNPEDGGSSGCNPNHWFIDTFLHAGGGLNGPIIGAILINDCTGEKKKVLFISATSNGYKLTPNCDNPSSGVVLLPFEPIKIPDPCEKTKEMLENTLVQEGLGDLEDFMDTPEWEEGNESGFKVGLDGLTTPTSGGLHATNLGNISHNAGAYHVHTPKGLHMFSPPDILRLIDFAFVQQPSTNVGNAFLGIYVKEPCSTCLGGFKYVHYVIRFNGNYNDLTSLSLPYSEKEIDDFTLNQALISGMYENQYQNNPPNDYMNSNGLEFVFFETLKDMGLDGKILLQRIDENNNITNLTKNGDEPINEVSCQ